jgi:uncharacterized membrane protein
MRKLLPIALVAIAFVVSIAAYPSLPDRIVTHWGIDGQPDGWSSRAFGAFLIPVMTLGTLLLMRVLPQLDPRRENYEKFRGTFDTLIVAIIAFLVALHIAVITSALGWPVPVDRVVWLGTAALFVVIGNLLPRARPNWFVGIRTPWTLSSDRVWERTHRVGGRIMVAGGIVIAALGFLSPRAAFWGVVATAVAISLGAIGYSYLLWRGERGG